MPDIRLTIVDPGHFHAALVQKEMYPNVAPRVHVYAPVGPELVDYLGRIARFNGRAEQPTAWELEVHAGPDFLARMQRERAGTVAIFSGRNRGKIQRIHAAIEAGLHVLADKPWIIRPDDLPVLESALQLAETRGLIAYDFMTGRHNVLTIAQRALQADPEVYGEQLAGSVAEPGVTMTSVHQILKQVAGAPNPRPPWFFDPAEQGDALADVGTHLVDRIHGSLFPDQTLDYRADIRVHGADRWPTPVTAEQFRQVTGEAPWPTYLEAAVRGDTLHYRCNTRMQYQVCGIAVALDLRWNWHATEGDDTHTAVYRGSRARLELRQGAPEQYRPELYVVPQADIADALTRRIAVLRQAHPGLDLQRQGAEWRVMIPDALRLGHDAQFIAMTHRFLEHVEQRRPLPAWERPNMLAKYHVCTQGVALAG
jgi:predicted dehydrogenase